MSALKFYVSADLEGVCGVCSPQQVFPAPGDDLTGYKAAVLQLGKELTALIQPLLDNPRVAEVYVNDAHARMRNLPLEALPQSDKLVWITGKPKPIAMLAGLDSSFDAALFLGYHAKASTRNGILCHSFNETIFDLRLNGVSVGETGLNAAYAWLHCGVPVALVVGDEALCQEAQALMPAIKTLATKRGLSFSCAEQYPVSKVLNQLKAFGETLPKKENEKTIYKTSWPSAFKAPYTLNVTFVNPVYADIAETMLGLTRLSGTEVQLGARDSLHDLYLAFQTLYSLTAYQKTI